MKTFRHSGDLGDIIYSLCAIKHLGGGDLILTPSPKTRVLMSPAILDSMKRLLLSQSYIHEIQYVNEYNITVDHDLDIFRQTFNTSHRPSLTVQDKKPLIDYILDSQKVPLEAKASPWLSPPPPIPIADVVINRSFRYRNEAFPWFKIHARYAHQAVFVGTLEEHTDFVFEVGPIQYQPIYDLYDMAQLIRGSKLFIGNQSCAYAIAEGMHHTQLIQEVNPNSPDCLFNRPGVYHGVDGTLELPNI